MGYAVFAFVVIFLLILSGGLLLFYREAMLQRVATVISPESKQASLISTIQQTGFSIGGVLGSIEKVLPKSVEEVGVVQKRLIRAGYREDNAVKIFYGTKVAVPVLLCLVAFLTGLGSYSPFFAYATSLGLGFLVPDFALGHMITKRQSKIRRGLADVIDLLVICIEAGLSLDQAVSRTTDELKLAQPVICDELTLVVLEQRAGRGRSEAWRNFAIRTDVDAVKNVVGVLVQSEKFGTSIAKSLRVHSDTLRTQRRQKVEEEAAKTTVKLVFPLVFFIFPSIFLVTLGPAVLIMMESFDKYFAR